MGRNRTRGILFGLWAIYIGYGGLRAGATLNADLPDTPQPGAQGGYENVLGTVRTLTVVRIDPDDDGAGHAGWPKYLVGRTPGGEIAWQFPRRLLFPGTGEHTEAELHAHFESIQAAAFVAKHSTVVAIGRHQYGLRARDGGVLWRKPAPDVPVLSLQPYGSGCFALVIPRGQPSIYHAPGPENYAALAHLDGQTGRWRWLRRVPVADRLAIMDGQLRVYAGKHQVAAFAPGSLLGG